MRNCLKISVLLVYGMLFLIHPAKTQTLQPSKIVWSEQQVGDYKKVIYEPQLFSYKDYTCHTTYYIKDHYILINSNYFIILDSELKEVYSRYDDRDASFFYKPVFFFHNNQNKPFVISIADGMEYYESEDVFVVNNNFTCAFLGRIPASLIIPNQTSLLHDTDIYIGDVLRLKDKGNGMIAFSFNSNTPNQNSDILLVDLSALQYTYRKGKVPSLEEWAILCVLQREVDEINNLPLRKKLVTYGGMDSINNVNITDYKEVDENVSFIYYDENGSIKKFVNLFSHPEESGYSIHYFDSYGFTIKTIIHEESAMNPSISGVRYVYNGKPVYSNFEIHNTESNEKETISGYSNEEKVFNNRLLDDIKYVENIEYFCSSIYQTEDLSDLEAGNIVKFTLPDKGDKTIINARNVPVRAKPQLKNNVLFNANTGDIATVIHKSLTQNIDNYGRYHWYFVEIGNRTGYVFGAFLEPIEKPMPDQEED